MTSPCRAPICAELCHRDWVLGENDDADATAQEIQIVQKYKRTHSLMPGNYRQTCSFEPTINAHQVIIRPLILTSLKVLSLKRYEVSILKGEVRGELRYLDKTLDPLFDIDRIWLESGDELSRDLVYKVAVGHVLPILHDPDDTCLRATCQILLNTRVDLLTSVWCLRSSSILSCVSLRSSVLSTFDETVLILIF